MLAHIIHDQEGKIQSIVFQLDLSGELTIQTGQADDLITIVDLRTAFPHLNLHPEDSAKVTPEYIDLLTREIRDRHRVDMERKALVPVS